MNDIRIPIHLQELHGLAREDEPVRIGVPLPLGAIHNAGDLSVIDAAGAPVPYQVASLAFWPDRSIKWLLVDALAHVPASDRATLYVCAFSAGRAGSESSQLTLRITQNDLEIQVDTGPARFAVSREGSGLLAAAIVRGAQILRKEGTTVRLIDAAGVRYLPVVERFLIEEQGPLRATVLTEGVFRGPRAMALQFRARITFTAGSGVVRIEYRVRNPRAALHAGGLWDLGDPRSCLIRDLSLEIHPAEPSRGVRWRAESLEEEASRATSDWSMYQDSSGGERWSSPNHVDRHLQLSVSFCGYRVQADGNVIAHGSRATPVVTVECREEARIHVGIERFWQNFPKALRWSKGVLEVGLFPQESRGGFEIQGGEQKRHTLLLDFAHPDGSLLARSLRPVAVSLDPKWVESSGALTWFTANRANPIYESYVSGMLAGPVSVATKREIIDEYGWRNFGDLYADHEAVNHTGDAPFVSHYNNQYDFVFGASAQYLRSGDWRWHVLMSDAARHHIDIDIYHTQEDRAVWNGGLFWHTDHHKPAATGTHRTYSRRNGGAGYGGGPSNEHDYSSGLLNYYYLTGDREAAQSVEELAEWVVAMDDGERTLFGILDAGPTGAASKTRDESYHHAGRGAGNSINTLLDAYSLTRKARYLAKAEQLLQRCIHPGDDVAALHLDEPESRWSYLVFLQVLGKYLAQKQERGETDYPFQYGRESLLRYARWMVDHEVPYRDVLHRVELPTETWPAQDIRKAHVLYVAASWSAGREREQFRERACFFFERCLQDLLSFSTANMTRPQVILSVYGWLSDYFLAEPEPVSAPDCGSHNYDFGSPVYFSPQRSRLKLTVRTRARVVLTEISRLFMDRVNIVRSRGRRSQ